jgi:hypothetical protein
MKYSLLLICLLSAFSMAENEWPKTLNEAVSNILNTMDEESKNKVRQTPKDDLIKYHHGWGTGIRNEFGLRKGNKELILSACGKPCHPDDASMKIIEAVWVSLNENP